MTLKNCESFFSKIDKSFSFKSECDFNISFQIVSFRWKQNSLNCLLNTKKIENKCFVCISINSYLRLLLYKLLWDVLKCTLRFLLSPSTLFSPKKNSFESTKNLNLFRLKKLRLLPFYFWSEKGKKAIRYWVKREETIFLLVTRFSLSPFLFLSSFYLCVLTFNIWFYFYLFLSNFLFFYSWHMCLKHFQCEEELLLKD